MTYLYCDKCHWLQDDFWDPKSYNPILQVEKDLLIDEMFDDLPLEMDKEEAEDRGIDYIKLEPWEVRAEVAVLVKRKDYAAAKLEEFARRIRNKVIKTRTEFEEYKEKNGMKCPTCGESTILLLENP